MNDKAQQQEAQYRFPYHHIPTNNGNFSQSRVLSWGFEYLSYIEKLLKVIKQLEFSSLIDIGCGDGRLLTEIDACFPGKKLVGTDFSENALAFARAFCPTAEYYRTPPDETYDIWTLTEVLEHIPLEEVGGFLDSLRARMHDGSHGIITVPSTNVPVHSKHYQHFSSDSLRAILEKHFTVVSLEYLNAYTWEVRTVQRFLSNKVFSVQYSPLLSAWYRRYVRKHLHATPKDGKRLLAVVSKKI